MSALRTLDLFCGAGGLSLGFEEVGFQVGAAIDFDDAAIATYRLNSPSTHAFSADIADVGADDLMQRAGFAELDVLIGGPSCQGFSTHGRRNGWVRDDDPRNYLYKHYARILHELRPKLFLMENVSGLMYFERGAFARRILDALRGEGYQLRHKLVLAADYGVPQLRKRLIIVGTLPEVTFRFPRQTHMGAYRRDTVGLWETRRKKEYPHLEAHRPVWDAISDLPVIAPGGGTEEMAYSQEPHNDYQTLLRGTNETLFDHQATSVAEDDLERIKHVGEGHTWREIPIELLPPRFAKIRRTDGTNLYARLSRERPSYTITTEFTNVTTGCYTHPLSDRALSIREGARIQSFPDSYRFTGGIGQKARQIGNAVPPMLANRLATQVLEGFGYDVGDDWSEPDLQMVLA